MPRRALYLTIIAALVGCNQTELAEVAKPVAPSAASTKKPSTPKNAPAKSAAKKTASRKTADAPPTEESAEETQQTEYQPPFPERENLFLAPKRSVTHMKSGSIEQTVELLGFANVKGARVILSINGNVVPIAEGGEEAGIEVISIQPPAVVLQRDRERWQATLEN